MNLKNIGIPRLVLVLIAGCVLIILTANDWINRDSGKNNQVSNSENSVDSTNNNLTEDEYKEMLEKRLENTLTGVSGVGRTKVMITFEGTGEKVALKDEATVFEEDGSSKTPYVIKEIEPVVKGVVVVAEGGGDITVKKEIIEAVMVLFGLESHKIKVMKLV